MQNESAQFHKIFTALGTINTLTVFSEADKPALILSKDRIMDIHRRFSAFSADSEISAVNRAAGKHAVVVSEDLFSLIEASLQLSEITEGAFDITSGASALLWKKAIKTMRMPSSAEIEAAAALTSYKDVTLSRKDLSVMLGREGQRIDLGAIAKGFAAMEARRVLTQSGVEKAVIDLGGTIIPVGTEKRIGLQRPFAKKGETFMEIKSCGDAVVTSGIYEQYTLIDDAAVHHLTDPRTGCPADNGIVSATLTGPDAAVLDALATASLILEPGRLPAIYEGQVKSAVLVTRNGEIYTYGGKQ